MKNRTSHLGIVLRAFLIVALAAGMASLPGRTAQAASFVVNSNGDAGDAALDGVCATAGGVCTLRAAIQEANNTVAADTITFAGDYTIPLASTLTLTTNMTIDGTGHTVTVSGGNTVGVFQVNVGVTATLNRLTITNGNAVNGGGIFNSGMLTVTNSTVSNSRASWIGGGIVNIGILLTLTNTTLTGNTSDLFGGGIFNIGGLTITSSTISSNSATQGGGVYNDGNMGITSSTLSGNSTDALNGQGGGIYNTSSGALSVTDCTFSGNAGDTGFNTIGGGGIYNSGSASVTGSTFTLNSGFLGGGIYTVTGTLTVTNTTFSGNTSTDGGGIFNDTGGTLNVLNSTFSGNTATWEGGGIFNYGTLNYTNTIIANSILPPSHLECYCGGTIGTNLNNLVEDGSGAAARSGDPALDPAGLANYGGPTQTIALTALSPAVNNGAAACPAADQRGVGRVGVCDLGAFEYDPVPQVVVSGSSPADGAVLASGISALQVVFNKDVLHDGSASAANNPVNYLLVGEGTTSGFQTLSCAGGLLPGDTLMAVNSASYDAGTFTATLAVNGGVPLPSGSYRLFVCGTTSVTDLVGLELNYGLSDALLTFRVGVGALPATGFAPGRVTLLPPQAVAYTTSGLWLEIPRLGVQADIVGVPQAGGTWDVSWLGSQAGWLQGSAFPTWAGNSAITGHVYDANGLPGPFVNLNQLWYGDRIVVHAFGQEYVYEVRSVRQVQPGDTAAITRHEDLPWLTLITCKGYDEASDSYRYRIVVRAVQVEIR